MKFHLTNHFFAGFFLPFFLDFVLNSLYARLMRVAASSLRRSMSSNISCRRLWAAISYSSRLRSISISWKCFLKLFS
jgi:hypothetical protein